VAKITIIRQGESLPFVFDRDGEDITGWTCLIEVKRFPDDLAIVSRTITPENGQWKGFLTQTETMGLDVSLYYLTALLRKVSTDEEEQKPTRFQVSKTWISETFSPAQLAGLVLWLDAFDIGTIIEFGGLVFAWNDKSGNANNATQLTTSLQPVTNANTINGKNVITYDGVDDVLDILANSSIDDLFSGGGSVFSVVNPLTAGGGNFGRIFDKGGETRNFIRDPSGGKVKYSHTSEFSTLQGSFETVTEEITLGVGNILSMLYDNSQVSNTPEFRINRSLIATSTTIIPIGTASSDAANDLMIGNDAGSTRTWGGYFGEIIMYDRILTADEITALEGYLSEKWGI